MFGRKKKSQLGPYESARPEDRLVLAALINAGADLTQPRHVLHFINDLVDKPAADGAADAIEDWQSTVKPPPEGYDTWSATFDRHDYVLTVEHVVRDFSVFDSAARASGGRYDGWEASV